MRTHNLDAKRLGLPWTYKHPKDVFNEMRQCMDSIAGITWDRLERESSVTYPCVKEGDPGDPVVFIERFPTVTGRAKSVASFAGKAARTADGRPAPRPRQLAPASRHGADAHRRMEEAGHESALLARAYLLAGYANRLLGEHFCAAAFDGGSAVAWPAPRGLPMGADRRVQG